MTPPCQRQRCRRDTPSWTLRLCWFGRSKAVTAAPWGCCVIRANPLSDHEQAMHLGNAPDASPLAPAIAHIPVACFCLRGAGRTRQEGVRPWLSAGSAPAPDYQVVSPSVSPSEHNGVLYI